MTEQRFARYKERRTKLISSIGHITSRDLIVICGAIEGHSRFVQDKTFQYFTGIHEPAAVLCIEGDGREVLFVPNYNGVRAQWVDQEIVPSDELARAFGVDEIRYLGAAEQGYALVPFRRDGQYTAFLEHVKAVLGDDGRLLVTGQPGWQIDNHSQQMAWFLGKFMPVLQEQQRMVDISPQIAALRRTKDAYEIDCIEKAIALTAKAQRSAHTAIKPEGYEYEAVAAIEHMYGKHGCFEQAFPSIVATGKNATVLHYLNADAQFEHGDAVVVDIGATHDGYAADITRTYPVGGKFNDRQKEIYSIVLDAQSYIADMARPGMYLSSNEHQDKSLHHLCLQFFAKHGLENYMPHGIGHFMGLDVHDVGDRRLPLAPGDVITIEPGLYLPDEGIGVRIEDDYLLTEDGVRCLSSRIPKELAHIEG